MCVYEWWLILLVLSNVLQLEFMGRYDAYFAELLIFFFVPRLLVLLELHEALVKKKKQPTVANSDTTVA